MKCANMERNEKLLLLIIGKSANPRCFKNLRFFHEEYLANKKTLMTGEIFTTLVKQLVKEMKRKKTKIVLPPNTISKTNCGQNNYLEPWSSLEFYCATFLPSLFFGCLDILIKPGTPTMDEGVRACDIIHAYLQNQKCVILWADTSLAGIHPINPVLQTFLSVCSVTRKWLCL